MTSVMVTGAQGQLGKEMMELLGKHQDLLIYKGFDRAGLDITSSYAVEAAISEIKPDYVVNCAAYTAVDRAEDEPEAADLVNHLAVKHMAISCKRHGAILLHPSTDYVFDGTSHVPYSTTAPAGPQGAYGISKWNGEKAIHKVDGQSMIIRSSWVFGPYGHNFVKTMLKLGREKRSIRVVSDQIGRPTYTGSLAAAIWQIIYTTYVPNSIEIQHFANQESCTWAEFAQTIMVLAGLDCHVVPISTVEYPTKAKRPAYSVLDTTAWERLFPSMNIPTWREALQDCLLRLDQLSS